MKQDGDAEMWCEWQEQLGELYRLIPLTTAKQNAKAVVSLLCGKALTLYMTHRSRIEREQNELRAKSDSLQGILSAETILARSLDQVAR